MPYIVVTIWYPLDIIQEVVDKYFEMLKQYPFDRSLGKETISVASTTNKEGIKSISVVEVKEGKLREALDFAGNRMRMFNDIKGFNYKTRIWTTVAEGLEGLGMSLPG